MKTKNEKTAEKTTFLRKKMIFFKDKSGVFNTLMIREVAVLLDFVQITLPKKQFKAQLIGILEEIDYFY